MTTTHAAFVENLVKFSHELALKADKIDLLASKIDLAIALNDVPKRDEIASITIALDQTMPSGGAAELLTVTGTDGVEYSDFDDLFDLVQEHVFTNGPGAPTDFITKGTSATFDVQGLIAQIPALTNELQDAIDAFRVFVDS